MHRVCFFFLFFWGGGEVSAATLMRPPNHLGLVGHWRLASTALNNGKAEDTTSNANHGTISNALVRNQGYKFTSASNNVNLGDNEDLEGMATLTISAWVYPTVLAGTDRHIFDKGNWNSDPAMSYRLMYQTDWGSGTGYPNGYWRFHLKTSSGECSANGPNGVSANRDNQWHLITGTYDGTTLKIYDNGVSIGSVACTGTVNTNSYDAKIGGGFGTFLGNIADVRIYDRALSATEVTNLANDQDAGIPLGHWPLNRHVRDISGNGNHGVVNGAIPIGEAAYFDGVDDGINVGDQPELALTGNGTVSAWLYIPSTWAGDTYPNVVSKGATAGWDSNGWALFAFSNGNIGVGMRNGATSFSRAAANNLKDQWIHVVGTWDGTTVKVYRNGTLLTSTGQTISPAANSTPVWIGKDNNGQDFGGYIRDVRVYNRSLGATEIASLYALNAGLHKESKIKPPSRSGLVGQWKLSAQSVEGTGELSTNGGMESASSGMASSFSVAKTAPGTVTPSDAESTNILHGARSQKLVITDVGHSRFTQSFNYHTAGKTYRVKFSYKADNGGTKRFLGVYDISGGGQGSLFTQNMTSDGNWHTAEAIFTVPSNSAGTGYFDLPRVDSLTGTTTVYVDGFSVQEVRMDDKSGQGNNGTVYGSPTFTTGPHGESNGAMVFDGTDNWVEPASLPSGITDQITVSGWFKTTSAGGDIYSEWRGGANIILGLSGGNIKTYLNTNGTSPAWTYNRSTGLNDDQWHQVVAVYDGSYFDVYVDGKGVDVGNIVATGNLSRSSSYPAKIGVSETNIGVFGNWFNGALADIRVYNQALSGTEIAGLYQNSKPASVNSSQNDKVTDGLVGLWSFNGSDVNGSTVYDRSGSGYDGILNSGASVDIGKVGQGISLDGVNDYVETGNNFDLSNGSLSVWFKSQETAGENGYLIGQQNGSGTLSLYQNSVNQKLTLWIRNGAGSTSKSIMSTGVINDGEWHHAVALWGSGGMKLYIDGALNSSDPSTVYDDGSTSNLEIGCIQTLYCFKGLADEVRIYNRALSESEITQLYDLGR